LKLHDKVAEAAPPIATDQVTAHTLRVGVPGARTPPGPTARASRFGGPTAA